MHPKSSVVKRTLKEHQIMGCAKNNVTSIPDFNTESFLLLSSH